MTSSVTKPATPAAVADGARRSVREIETGHTLLPAEASHEAGGDARLAEGTLVSDRYRITRVLGEGGMGIVYAAEHVLMRKEVAIKVLHAEMCSNPEVVARFEREAIAAAHIDHPNVAGATDFGRLGDGAFFLVLELLRGASLRDEVGKGAIPVERALRILRGIVSGVAAAHAKGIVHRDLKPENVMLIERDGTPDFVKVLDFGIAKVDASVSSSPQADGKVLTRIGSVFGTPEYMAPEQALGETVDARADLYALGVIFLEMITGKCPFTGTALSILRERILAEGPPDMSSVADPGARALVSRLLVRHPADRMQSASDLLAAIDALTGDRRSVVAARGSRGPSDVAVATSASLTSAPTTRPRWIVPAVAGFALLFGALGAVAISPKRSTEKDRPLGAVQARATTSESAAPATRATESAATVENESDPPPAPTASAASARAAPRTKPTPQRRSQPAPRRTGPGGIYVPPPKDWFK
jgi:serine/threonine-protein kinase